MVRAASHADVFQAIACPTRRALIDALGRGERIVSDLVASLDITQSAVSQQLAILKSAGLVSERAEGRFRYYRLRTAPLAEIDVWLNRYRTYVERQLDVIGHVLDELPDHPAIAPIPIKPRRRKKSR
ncbi:MAG TPA: metalloregulator ArsR/SmtB family transcription factor [Polyangiaceae bacterium]|nr:metalloregulator ArsR/SmtB family transcription factor [Polyangiaceae bacterium]